MRFYPNHLLKAAVLISTGLLLATCYKGPITLSQPPDLPVESEWIYTAPIELWTDKMFSPPAILIPLADKQLMILTYRGEIYRYDLDIGERKGRVWQPMRMLISSHLLSDRNQMLYFASARDEEIHAYNLLEGHKLWKMEYPGIVGNMANIGKQLFAATDKGAIIAVNREDGKLTWERRLPGRFTNGVFSFDNRILALDDRGLLYAFDVISNDSIVTAWQKKVPSKPIYQAVNTKQSLLLFDSAGLIQAIDPVSGEVIFNKLLPDPIYSKPLITDQTMIVATASGLTYGLDTAGGDIIWEYQGAGLVKLPIMAATGTAPTIAIIPYSRGSVVALEIATGRMLWEYSFERALILAAITNSGLAVVDTRNRIHFLGAAE
jgi:outer membrane protein assembly factor BamB